MEFGRAVSMHSDGITEQGVSVPAQISHSRRNCSGFGRRGNFGPKQRNHNPRKQLSPLLPSDRSPNPFMEIVKHHLVDIIHRVNLTSSGLGIMSFPEGARARQPLNWGRYRGVLQAT